MTPGAKFMALQHGVSSPAWLYHFSSVNVLKSLVRMGLYAGISFLRSNWHGAAIEVVPGGAMRAIFRDFETVEDSESFDRLGSTGIFASLETIAGVSNRDLWTLTEQRVSNTTFSELVDADFGRCYNNFQFRLPKNIPDYVGISHPYGLSPAVRRALTALVDRSEPVPARIRKERDAVVNGLGRGSGVSGVCALETPLAIALEEAANGRVDLQSSLVRTVIVISPGAAGHETTVIQMHRKAEKLILTVLDFCETATGNGLPNDSLPANFGRHTSVEILYLGGNAAELAGRIAGMNQNCPIREVTEFDAALGVARYAALCGEGSFEIPGGSISVLDCHLVAPHSIGICGRSSAEGEGDVFWCPLIEAGELLGDKPVTILLADLPDAVILAECVSQTRQTQQWMVGTQDLRWHTEVDVSGVRNGEAYGQLEFTIQGSAGCLSYGWSDPFAAAVLRR